MTGFWLVAGLAALVGITWFRGRVRHERRMDQLSLRVHVNGIRGKSSVTRLVAAILREAGYVTVAKTTGSAARVILPTGEEVPIRRRGAATITEQLTIMDRYVTPGVEALVLECMAVHPLNQRHAEDLIVRADIGIITNVREDHQEVMGESLEAIADSLSNTIPRGGLLITAEERPELRERLAARATARGSRSVFADPDAVTDAEIAGFAHLEFRANVAVGLEVAAALGIDRSTAIRGMWKAVPDIGALWIQPTTIRGREVLWIPLFAANDRESVVGVMVGLAPYLAGRKRIGILNNRWDRGRRAELFADMVPGDLSRHLDHVITFGAFEASVTARLVEHGWPVDAITNLGESVDPSLDEILDAIADLIGPSGRGALVGMVNIHTPQAELLLEHFAAERGALPDEDIERSRDAARLPEGVRRYRAALQHHVDTIDSVRA